MSVSAVLVGDPQGNWLGHELGQPSHSGSEIQQDGVWTIRGGGAGPFFLTPAWAGRFLHRRVEGDFRFTARVLLPRCRGGRVGVMVRDSLEAKGWFRFIHVDEGRVRGLVRYPDGLVNWGYADSMPVETEAVWLRLERSGRCIVARWSRNGMDWMVVSPTQKGWVSDATGLEVGIAVMRDENDKELAEGVVDHLRLEPLTRSYRTSWIGNSGGANPDWVQNHIAALAVAPNGTVYTAAEWDEGTREMGIYRDGKIIGMLEGGFHDGEHHTAVACDATQVIAVAEESGSVGLRRFSPDGHRLSWKDGGHFLPLPGAKRAGAIALAGDMLAVADMDWNKPELAAQALRLYRLTPRGPELLQSWPVERIGRVAVSVGGEAWAIQQARIERFQVVEPAQVQRFKLGAAEPVQRVSEAGDASAVAVAPDGKLWVADNGAAQRIRIFDVSGPEPKPAGFFGDEGGVYGGRPGAVADRKLPPRIVGIGFDEAGKIIVGADGWGWCGTDLRGFAKDGTMNWQLVGLHGVIDMGGFDPGSENDVFSGSEHYTLDWSAPDGPSWKYAGYTLDPLRFPEDARLIKGLYTRECTRVRRVHGKRILLVGDMSSEHLAIYRFDEAHGEIAIPCARVMAKGGGAPNAPQGPWLWMDANSDGAYQAGEFTALPDLRPGCGPGMDLDSAGDLWIVGSKILRLRFASFDLHGAPTWNPQPELTERPSSFPSVGGHELKQVLSVPDRKEFWLSGWGAGRPNPLNFFANSGSLLTRYAAAPTDAAAKPSVTIPLPTDFLGDGQVTRSFDVAGDYVFTADQYDARILVYDARNGNLVHTMVPGPEVGGRSGWVDVAHGLSAIRRSNGEYAVLVEDDAFCKLTLYRWNPADTKLPPTPVVRVENGALTWPVDESVGSWTVQVLDGKESRVLARNLRVAQFEDPDRLTGARRYQVLAVNAAGWSVPSAIVELSAHPVGKPLVLRSIGSDAGAVAQATKILDGNPESYSYLENPKAWIGAELPEGTSPVRLRLLPRPGHGAYLRHGVLEGCNGDPAKGPWTHLLTADREIGDGWQQFAISNKHSWRYLRWRSAAGRNQMLAELQVLGSLK